MVRHRSWQMGSWIHATVSGVVQLVGLPACSSSSTDVWPVLNQACHWNTCAWLKRWSQKACWINVRASVALFPRLAQYLMHTRCSLFWSIVKTAHVHPATCNLAHWLTRHDGPTIYWCFVLPQLLYRWWYQSGKFWITPRTYILFTAALMLSFIP